MKKQITKFLASLNKSKQIKVQSHSIVDVDQVLIVSDSKNAIKEIQKAAPDASIETKVESYFLVTLNKPEENSAAAFDDVETAEILKTEDNE